MSKNTEIFYIPNYVLLCVFSFLSPPDLLKVGKTCKKFNTIKDTNLLWVQFLKNEFKKVLAASDYHYMWAMYLVHDLKEILKAKKGRTVFVSWNGDTPWYEMNDDNRNILILRTILDDNNRKIMISLNIKMNYNNREILFIEKNWNSEGIGSTKKKFIQLYKKNQEHLKKTMKISRLFQYV